MHALRPTGFGGIVVTAARFEDGVEECLRDGADAAFNVFAGAGLELADQAVRIYGGAPPTGPITIV